MIHLQRVRSVCRTIALLAVASAVRAQGPRGAATDPRDTITSFAVGGWGLHLGDRDLSILPGDDFARYQNGRWIAQITGEALETIFAPVTQFGRSLSAPKEGAGLGLAMSRGLAEAMGGELTVTTVEGEGSTFSFD